MEALIPILTSVGGALGSKLVGKAVDSIGGGGKKEAAPEVLKKAAPLFAPSQIVQAQDRYKQMGIPKWNQVSANMGGTTGPDVPTQIGSQADMLGKTLGGLTTDSGYGDNPMN